MQAGTIHPGQERTLPVSASTFPSEQDLLSIFSEAMDVFFYGVVTYDDMFGGHHRTTFGTALLAEGPVLRRMFIANTANIIDDMRYFPTVNHNAAD